MFVVQMTKNSSSKTNSPNSFRHERRYLPNMNTNDSKITQVNDGLSSDLEQSVNILDGSTGRDDKTVTPVVMADQISAVGEDDSASGASSSIPHLPPQRSHKQH